MGVTITSGVTLGPGIQLELSPPPPLTPYRMSTWGTNDAGKLGDNTIISRSSPVLIGATHTWSVVAPSNNATAAIRENRTLWTWGTNSQGQLGINSASSATSRSSPAQVGSTTTWDKLARTNDGFLATRLDGTLWAWGVNSFGELGLGDVISRSSPTQVGTGTTWKNVWGFNYTAVAQRTDNTLWFFGRNNYGQIGDNTIVNKSSPVQIGTTTTWGATPKVAFFDSGTLVVKTDGTLWAWGDNGGGKLGTNDLVNRSSPVQVGALTDWANVAGNGVCGYAVKTTGTLWSWGNGILGSLGSNSVIRRSSPAQIGSATDWSNVAAGNNNAWAVKTGGTAWGIGGATSGGQLGINLGGSSQYRSSPVQIGSLTTWQSIVGSQSGQTTVIGLATA